MVTRGLLLIGALLLSLLLATAAEAAPYPFWGGATWSERIAIGYDAWSPGGYARPGLYDTYGGAQPASTYDALWRASGLSTAQSGHAPQRTSASPPASYGPTTAQNSPYGGGSQTGQQQRFEKGYYDGLVDGGTDALAGRPYKITSQRAYLNPQGAIEGSEKAYPVAGEVMIVRVKPKDPQGALAYQHGYAQGYEEGFNRGAPPPASLRPSDPTYFGDPARDRWWSLRVSDAPAATLFSPERLAWAYR